MRIRVLSAGFVVFFLSGTAVSAAPVTSPRPEVQENVRQLQEKNNCPGCDLAGAILHRGEFAGANLEGANLAGAQLNLADLAGANLKNANLQGASFGGADLAGADLTGANLTGAIIEGAYLTGAKMDGKVVVRKPYAAEGGPDVGEKAIEEAEGKSKSLPFTNQAMVEEEGRAAEAAPPVEEAAVETGAAAAVDTSRPEPLDAVPLRSKQVNVMSDAVVSSGTVSQPPEHVSVAYVREPSAEATSGKSKGEVIHSEPENRPERALEMEPSANELDEEMTPPPAEETGMTAIPQPEATPKMMPGQEAEPVRQFFAREHLSGEGNQEVATAEPAQVSVEPQEFEQPVSEEIIEAEQLPVERGASAAPKLETEEVQEKPQASESASSSPMIGAVKVADHEPPADTVAEKKAALVEKLLDDNRCVACDLSGVDLSGRDLEDADLERVNLRGANLNDTDLEDANLKGADLRDTDLRGADLRKADLYRADISGADLTGAKLLGALVDSLIAEDVVGADFAGAVGRE